jgi:hypothetical protein
MKRFHTSSKYERYLYTKAIRNESGRSLFRERYKWYLYTKSNRAVLRNESGRSLFPAPDSRARLSSSNPLLIPSRFELLMKPGANDSSARMIRLECQRTCMIYILDPSVLCNRAATALLHFAALSRPGPRAFRGATTRQNVRVS